ncbi:outer membrane efflux protein [Orenia metallireducens]|uniref:Outer membrane efflux protein n=1 Tax=Orenia metallireducens TaxID=1413210 RepID=A0A285F5T0_9FIRM|nr:TolC family protein [Orenia metallireducens]PRX34892.1 outer membrane efflux protein [Orenia metallireducens]SNY06074.1 Outer membrane efflux protein [Orenia metallireducens]
MKLDRGIKVSIFLVAMVLVLSISVFAASKERIDKFEAVQIALEDSIDLEIAKLDLANAKLTYQRSQAENLINQSVYSNLEAQRNLLQAQKDYYQSQTGLINQVLTEYSELILLNKKLKLTEKKVELEKSLLDKVELAVKRGYKDDLELLKQKNDYNEILLSLEELSDDYQEKLINLKLTLDLNTEQNLNLQTWSLEKIWKLDKAEIIASAVKNSFDLQVKEEVVELAQRELERAQQVSTPKLDLQELENNLKIAKLEKESSKKELIITIEQDYYSFKQAIKKIDSEEAKSAASREEYQLVQQEQEKGLKSADDLLSAEIEFLEAEYNYQAAIVDYYLNRLQLQIDMGLQVEVLLDEIKL